MKMAVQVGRMAPSKSFLNCVSVADIPGKNQGYGNQKNRLPSLPAFLCDLGPVLSQRMQGPGI